MVYDKFSRRSGDEATMYTRFCDEATRSTAEDVTIPFYGATLWATCHRPRVTLTAFLHSAAICFFGRTHGRSRLWRAPACGRMGETRETAGFVSNHYELVKLGRPAKRGLWGREQLITKRLICITSRPFWTEVEGSLDIHIKNLSGPYIYLCIVCNTKLVL